VLSAHHRTIESRGIRAGRVVRPRGVYLAAYPVHLAEVGASETLCGIDAEELPSFPGTVPDSVAREDRCQECFSLLG
jgi:hypothetical protein